MTVDHLADLAQVSRMTVLRFETEKTSPITATIRHIRSALEKAGAEFPDLETVRFPGKAVSSGLPGQEPKKDDR